MRKILRALRFVLLSLLLGASFVVFLTSITNVFINLGLPILLNPKPERIQITWRVAWMIVPGDVHVSGLRIRSQGATDQWELTARHATGTIDLWALPYQR